jgi:hypothetical protein
MSIIACAGAWETDPLALPEMKPLTEPAPGEEVLS